MPKSFGVDLEGTRYGAGLKPRFHRGFVYADARVDDGLVDVTIVPGGLTRVALDEGAMVVNSTQNGGAKGPVHLYVSKSSDGGETWTVSRLDTSGAPPPCGCGGWAFWGAQPAVAVDGQDAAVRQSDLDPQDLAGRGQGPHALLEDGELRGCRARALQIARGEVGVDEGPDRRRVAPDDVVERRCIEVRGDHRGLRGRGDPDQREERPIDEDQEDGTADSRR